MNFGVCHSQSLVVQITRCRPYTSPSCNSHSPTWADCRRSKLDYRNLITHASCSEFSDLIDSLNWHIVLGLSDGQSARLNTTLRSSGWSRNRLSVVTNQPKAANMAVVNTAAAETKIAIFEVLSANTSFTIISPTFVIFWQSEFEHYQAKTLQSIVHDPAPNRGLKHDSLRVISIQVNWVTVETIFLKLNSQSSVCCC